ncbi:MAG: polyphenol oxidase family protein, partial [Pseudoflavonifractor sp.]
MEFTERTKDGVTYEQVSELGVPHGFSTRIGGVSEGIYAALNLGMHRGDDPECVAENYRRFCAAVGVERGSMVFTNQVHSATVRICTSADRGYGPDRPIDYEADGLVTDVPGLVLTIFAADCLPVLLYDPVRQVIAAVHAGWRGTAGDIVGNAVARMRTAYGCRHQDIRAAIGPCI